MSEKLYSALFGIMTAIAGGLAIMVVGAVCWWINRAENRFDQWGPVIGRVDARVEMICNHLGLAADNRQKPVELVATTAATEH